MPRIKKNKMGQYMPTVDEYKAYHWCINNMIYISPFATGNGTWYIDIQINNKKHRSPDTYGSVTIWVKMYEYYKYYYIKYANKV
jgi:hypothetical protein